MPTCVEVGSFHSKKLFWKKKFGLKVRLKRNSIEFSSHFLITLGLLIQINISLLYTTTNDEWIMDRRTSVINLIWIYSIFFCGGSETEIWYTAEYDDASAYQKYSECMAQIYTPGKYRFVNYPFWPDLPIYNMPVKITYKPFFCIPLSNSESAMQIDIDREGVNPLCWKIQFPSDRSGQSLRLSINFPQDNTCGI